MANDPTLNKPANLKKYREEAHCMWCGSATSSPDYIVNPGGDPVLKCCSEPCYELTRDFVARDARARKPFWIALATAALSNLVVIGLEYTGPAAYLPLLAIAVIVFVWPSVFTHYQFYARFGLVKTRRIFRVLAALLGALAIAASLSVL